MNAKAATSLLDYGMYGVVVLLLLGAFFLIKWYLHNVVKPKVEKEITIREEETKARASHMATAEAFMRTQSESMRSLADSQKSLEGSTHKISKLLAEHDVDIKDIKRAVNA